MRNTADFTIYAGPKNKAGQTVYYYRVRDERGIRHSGKSTGKTSRSAARRRVLELIASEQITENSSLRFSRFAEHWWLPGKCNYLKIAANNGRAIGAHHAAVQRSYLTCHILPHFAAMPITSIRVRHIEQWRLQLYQRVAPATAANVFSCLRTMLNEAERLELISSNPVRRVKPPRVTVNKRVIPSAEETRALFLPQHWSDPVALAANLFAAFTGARLGECLGLQCSDVLDGYVVIRHSMGRLDGLKGTKTGVVREIPVPELLQTVLQRLIADNGDGFVFSRDGGRKPLYDRTVTGALRQALLNIGLSAEQIRERKLTFHCWRHFYNSVLLRHGVPLSVTQQLVGHTTVASTTRYNATTSGTPAVLRDYVESALKEYVG